MKIAAVQAAIAYGDVEKNYALAAENIKKAAAAGAGLVVLSELWNTSFYPPDIMDLADRMASGHRPFWQKKQSATAFISLAVPLPIAAVTTCTTRPLS